MMGTRRVAWQNREGHNDRLLWNLDLNEIFEEKESEIQSDLAASIKSPLMICRIFLCSDDDTWKGLLYSRSASELGVGYCLTA